MLLIDAVIPSQRCAMAAEVSEPVVFMYPESAGKKGTLLARLPLHPRHAIEFFNKEKLLRCRYVSALSWTFLVVHAYVVYLDVRPSRFKLRPARIVQVTLPTPYTLNPTPQTLNPTP